MGVRKVCACGNVLSQCRCRRVHVPTVVGPCRCAHPKGEVASTRLDSMSVNYYTTAGELKPSDELADGRVVDVVHLHTDVVVVFFTDESDEWYATDALVRLGGGVDDVVTPIP